MEAILTALTDLPDPLNAQPQIHVVGGARRGLAVGARYSTHHRGPSLLPTSHGRPPPARRGDRRGPGADRLANPPHPSVPTFKEPA